MRDPRLVDGAFVIIAWVGIKLLLEYLGTAGYLALHIPRWFSLGLVVVIFAIAFLWARLEGPVEANELAESAEQILGEENKAIAEIDGNVEK